MAIALVACGVPLAAMAGVPDFDVVLVFVVAWGVGMAIADVATSTLLYRLLDAPLLPRVTGAIESAKLALEGIGAFLAPVLVTTVGVRATLIVSAVPLPIVVLFGWRLIHRADTSASDRTRRLSVLHDIPFLRSLDMVGLETIAAHLVPQSVAQGTDVVRQGDHGDRFYVVESGAADVLLDGFLCGIGEGGWLLRGKGPVARRGTHRDRPSYPTDGAARHLS